MDRGTELAQPKRKRRARGSLSREEILGGARDLIEKHGLQELSMPGLARHLGSGVTSIYWYFRSKQELLVALAEFVTHEVYARLPPVSDRPWNEELEAYFTAFREEARKKLVFLELFAHHPRFLFTRPEVTKILVPRIEDELSVLVQAGLSTEQAAHVYSVGSAYTRGFILLEHHLVGEQPDDSVEEKLDPLIAGLDPAAYPTLTQLPSFERAMWLDDERFRFGLRLLIAGIFSEFDELTMA